MNTIPVAEDPREVKPGADPGSTLKGALRYPGFDSHFKGSGDSAALVVSTRTHTDNSPARARRVWMR
ncbi:MAG: hypothetical protein ACO3I0_16155, partial [Limisphaerales bacterium]